VTGEASSTSTLPDEDRGRAASDRGLWLRRIGLALLALFLLASVAGCFGVRSRTITDEGADGIEARLTYPQVARPGLAVPWRLVVVSPDGFSEPITVRVRSAYLRSFDFNGMDPVPDATTSDGGWIEWEWDPPRTEHFEVSIDSRVEPGVQWAVDGTTEVVAEGETLTLDHRTWIAP
jgi:hypothetical protein